MLSAQRQQQGVIGVFFANAVTSESLLPPSVVLTNTCVKVCHGKQLVVAICGLDGLAEVMVKLLFGIVRVSSLARKH